MKDYKKILLNKDATIKEALEIINRGSMRLAIVTDGLKLVGIISDPDIRRAMLDGYSLSDNILNITNKNPIVCHVNDTKEEILNIAISKNI